MSNFEIPQYHRFISKSLAKHLLQQAKPVPGIPGLSEIGKGGGLETTEGLQFLVQIYSETKSTLGQVLRQRELDRQFLDERTKAYCKFNTDFGFSVSDPEYETAIGLEDASGRVVFGPKSDAYAMSGGQPVAPIPDFLKGHHVTLFGPPDSAKMAINAMNSYHRKLKDEPAIVSDLLNKNSSPPKWGADDEDSKTPLRRDLIDAGVNLTACFDGTITFQDAKAYNLATDNLALPIKRFPGLALPTTFLFLNGTPIPLHLYDFALHLFKNWHNPKALCFYVPKLENEEEARYIHLMIQTAERLIKAAHPDYVLGSVRLMIVLENPRAILRTHEIMDALYPYFVGASLGWHDYLASTARTFKEDSNYRIPVKADPDIVIKYIKASHLLLADVVGSRGGIKVGGMYGILPLDTDPKSESFQITLVGFIKDVITQMKRDLTGFWVAHPDFVRLGIALVKAWEFFKDGQKGPLEELIKSLLAQKYHKDILNFISGPDIDGLRIDDPNYVRSLIVADIKESDFISNSDPEEIRYNVFQSLQYLTDWLCGNGCVALPSVIKGVPVRVMDDLATAERSRWEVWHEIYHQRIKPADFIKIVFEEMNFIRKDLSDSQKIVQVKYNEQTSKWYPLALRIMIKLMTDRDPPEFATELLIPFTVDSVRSATDPVQAIQKIDPDFLKLDDHFSRLVHYFEACGSVRFADILAKNPVMDLSLAEKIVMSFSKDEVIEAAFFHGDIGQSKKTLDSLAASEQAKALSADEATLVELRELARQYLENFGFKFLVSAKDKSAIELLNTLRTRSTRTATEELTAAKEALWQITRKRLEAQPLDQVIHQIEKLKSDHQIEDYGLSVINGEYIQELGSTEAFQYASLSKTIASCFAIQYFAEKGFRLDAKVAEILKASGSDFQLLGPWADAVTLEHLMNHSALSMHYVKGFKSNIPDSKQLLTGQHGYEPVRIINEPGKSFAYSGGGFLLLQHLIESFEKRPIHDVVAPFLSNVGLRDNVFTPQGEFRFPAFAAGGTGTAGDYAQFLQKLTTSFHHIDDRQPIAHDTAVTMLFGKDFGSRDFIGAKAGLGNFIIEAGENRLALHQGANEGFRALYLMCFAGPDKGKGFVLLAKGDNEAVPFICKAAQVLLQSLTIQGIDFSKFQHQFDRSKIKQEQIVNQEYKAMIFDAFLPCLPPPTIRFKGIHPLAKYDVAIGASISNVSNQIFARAENLIDPHEPQFLPDEYCPQGKVMDSWETTRHNQKPFDSLELKLKRMSKIKYVGVSTKYHDGNHFEAVELEAWDPQNHIWKTFLPKTKLAGHSYINLRLVNVIETDRVRVKAYPDGGLTRLQLFETVPDESLFDGVLKRYDEDIPKPMKPQAIPYTGAKPKSNSKSSLRFDFASVVNGAKMLRASNEHYSPAVQALSPFSPIHMFDGFESARSRKQGNYEEGQLQLARPTKITRVEFDFTYFVNNNPMAIHVFGKGDGDWIPLAPMTSVKEFSGNTKILRIQSTDILKELLIRVYPDGGINRIRIYND